MTEREQLIEAINKQFLAGATEKELRLVYIAVKGIFENLHVSAEKCRT